MKVIRCENFAEERWHLYYQTWYGGFKCCCGADCEEIETNEQKDIERRDGASVDPQ